MKIYTGSDHAGLSLKRRLIRHLQEHGHEVVDLGTDSDASCDYADFAHAVAERVTADPAALGLLTCGSGIGMSIAANRHRGVRAALCHNSLEAGLSRKHNNANILVLGGRIIGEELAIDALDAFLNTGFEGGRHERRIGKIERP
ncbi:MAG TPA: ribose 5-phosphate isomerase B [Candidatus Ozemobacteraceae bacterium]|nr:ribose 5-phosphate isomerase B [Candidatus Ozemobacteraceae bacterium]